ncbi:MAG: alpha-glucan family phosphorylase [Pseudonocardiales bacterium]|nr:alpha-glucan family phosphorylase [Pseudonocardiales bacterium]MBV9030638.1 alpha-glucan family phosphorylase [Pseudonocardiales bacterium]
MRALRRFTVRAQLPGPLAPLETLVTNLRWTWHPPTQDLFASLDEGTWAAVNGDPVRLLGEIPTQRLTALAADETVVARTRALAQDLRHYLDEPRWYQQRPETLPAAIGYFSMEFGVSEVLPFYSGGLGVLAGDHLKAASDLGVPLIGVGLLYHSGYFRQSLSLDGWQLEHYPALDPQGLPLHLVADATGAPILVHVGMPGGRVLRARIWRADVGRVPLLLLDSDIEDNPEDLRGVTDRLYGGDQDHRITQEILAGIGGVRAIRLFCRLTGHPEPEVFHTNEGHAGFLGLERIRELISGDGLSFDEALAAVRAGTVFTTHTPVAAGIDRFPVDLVRHHFAGSPGLLPGVDIDRVLALGAEDSSGMFNMAHMGLRLAQRANGVSRLNGAVARTIFRGLWPRFDVDEVPIGSVTNGVHGPTWAAREIASLLGESDNGSAVASASEPLLWELRGVLRAKLVDEVRRRVRAAWLERGASAPELGWTSRVFDPEVLTMGFARRVPTYKRLTLMLRDPDRLRALLLDSERPVQLIIAGKSHPADDGGKALIQQVVRFADAPDVRHRMVFLPDYDMSMARFLYWGCDVWLNNPLRPLEACGTSGMKSALNGGLNLSIRDGWWDELYDGESGWAIPTADGVEDPQRRDTLEAYALYELIATQVAPRFYDRGPDGVPRRWVSMVHHTLASVRPRVQACRMVQEYVERLYSPAAGSAAAVRADSFAGARALAEYRSRLRAAWSRVRVAQVDISGLPATPELGSEMTVRAAVALAGLQPRDVGVQTIVGRVDDRDELRDALVVAMRPVCAGYCPDGDCPGEDCPGGGCPEDDCPGGDSPGGDCPEGGGEETRFEATLRLPHAGLLGYTVRVLPRHPLMATPAEFGLVHLA